MAESLRKISLQRRLSFLALVLHALAAIAWFALMPRAFPLAHPRFWLNDVLPMIVLLAIAASVRWRAIALFAPAMWLADAISGLVAFPHDFRIVSVAYVLLAAGLFCTLQPSLASSRSSVRIALLLGAMIGAVAPWLVRPGTPQTHPLNIAFDASDLPTTPFGQFQRLGSNVGVSPNTGHVSLDLDRVRLDIAPLLTFTSRSIDGAPVIVTSRATRSGPARMLTGMTRRSDDSIDLRYSDDGESRLRVSTTSDRETSIEATSRLPRAVYSHLNTFTEIDIVGHKRLQLAFSPCGDAKFDATFSEYPRGKPARFAYVDVAHSTFRVVEATSAEKGPFHTLGEGPLQRGEPLTITLFDDGRAIGSITFNDWSAQASDERSPTAGWDVPANAIEFSLYFEPRNSVAGIWLSLASTSVGRGWDTVGHAGGTYRNQMTIKPAPSSVSSVNGVQRP